MSEWKRVTVADIAAPIKNALVGGPFGSNLVSADYTDSGIPVIRGQNMGFGRWVDGEFVFVAEDKALLLSANLAKPGDIVFTQRGTIGQVAIVPNSSFDVYLLSQSQMKLTVEDRLAYNLFIYYVFTSQEQQDYIRQHAIQTGVPHTNLGILKNTPIKLPPLPEQHAIAHILGSLDDKIELNRQMNETLEAMARALFKDWFVDFGPVRAKMAGQQPPGLAADIAALFPDALDGEGKPVGWELGSLIDIAHLNPESWSKKNSPAKIDYVDLANTKWGTVETTISFAWEDAPSRAQRILRIGDTIVGTVRPGNGSYSYINVDGLTGSTGFAVLRPKSTEYQDLLYLAATDQANIERLSHLADGGAYPAVRPDIVANSPINLPMNRQLISDFSKITSPWISRIEHNKEESRTLAELRDLLLPKLLSGELRVQDVEALVAQRS